MRRQITSIYVVPSLVAIAFLIIGAWLAPRVNPQLAGTPKVTKPEAREISRTLMRDQGLDPEAFFEDSYFASDQSAFDYLVRTLGIEQAFELANSEATPLTYWNFLYHKNVPRDSEQETFLARISPSGRIVGFIHNVPDSVKSDSISVEAALELARDYLQRTDWILPAETELARSSLNRRTARIDHWMRFNDTSEGFGEGKLAVEIRVSGDRISQVYQVFREPASFASQSGVFGGANLLFNGISVTVYVLLTIFTLVVFLRHYHAGVVSVRNGLIAAGLLFALLISTHVNAWSYFGTGSSMGPISRFYTKLILLGIQLGTAYAFMFINVFSAWSVGHYELNKAKPQLLHGIQSLLNREFFTRNVGREVPIGFVWGTILFGGIMIVNFILAYAFGAQPRLTFGGINHFSDAVPLYGILASVLFAVIYGEVFFRKFLVTYLFRRTQNLTAAILISAAIYSIFSIFFDAKHVFWPTYFGLVPHFLVGLIQAWVFWRFGLLAAMTSIGLYTAYDGVAMFLSADNPAYFMSAAAVVVLFVCILIFGILSLVRGKQVVFEEEEEPAHIRRIKEQTRMQKELEIARRVQLGLLPKDNPDLSGFDISGVCLPAQEVGGDYFDFISLKNGNLGIAVGDVSGKGVPAAIYMTLTKGILQSHAEGELSPKEVLSKVNNLMYRTIEKSWYVSMFYAVLDPAGSKLRFARAGHNPAIVLNQDRQNPELLQTAGIGLGLDVGEIFTKTLVEGEIGLSKGDTLVFYTDGFTEAMNISGEEFGEDRFLSLLRTEDNGTAESLLRRCVEEIRDFAGDAPQHDDMTMVVLKV